jgi:hypothetical protein
MSRACTRLRIRYATLGRAEVLDEVNLCCIDALQTLQQRIEQLFGVPVAEQRLRAGVPPRLVESVDDIQPMDTVLLEQDAAAAGKRQLGAAPVQRGRKRLRKSSLDTSLEASLAPEGTFDATAALGSRLVQALSGRATGSEVQAFRRAVQEARVAHEEQVRAQDRYRAALERTYEFASETSTDTTLMPSAPGGWRVRYPKLGARSAVHEDERMYRLSLDLLRAIIGEVYAMSPEWRENLRPTKMALVSPLVFWNLVEYWWSLDHEIVPDIENALSHLMPSLDWQWLRTRRRTPSRKHFRSF